MSDNGTNFVGALSDLVQFLRCQKTNREISEFCSADNIQWKFIPERAPHFGGLWEAAVKSVKYHTTTCCRPQVDIRHCFNSSGVMFKQSTNNTSTTKWRSHRAVNSQTLHHRSTFTSYSRPIWIISFYTFVEKMALSTIHGSTSLAKMVIWISHYSVKVAFPIAQSRDIVVIKEDALVTPLSWPLARVVEVHAGSDGHVWVATVKTSNGTYKRPVSKLVPLVVNDEI